MVTNANEPPLDTSIRVNDDFDCITDGYQGLVRVGNVGVWFLIDSDSAVTFIWKSDAEFVAQYSYWAKIKWQEQISQWHGYEHVRTRTFGTVTVPYVFFKQLYENVFLTWADFFAPLMYTLFWVTLQLCLNVGIFFCPLCQTNLKNFWFYVSRIVDGEKNPQYTLYTAKK